METTLSTEFANKEIRKPSPFLEGATFKIVKIEEGSFNGNSFIKLTTDLDERGLSVRSFTRPTFGRFVKDGILEAQPRVSVPNGTANKAVAKILTKETVKTNGDLVKELDKIFDKKTLICHCAPFQTLDGHLSNQLSFDFIK